MDIERLMLPPEKMLHLRDLGFTPKNFIFMYYHCNGEWIWSVAETFLPAIRHDDILPTLTLQEILELLPTKIEVGPNYSKHLLEVYTYSQLIRYATGSGRELCGEFFHGNILDAAYRMLCWVIENGYLKS